MGSQRPREARKPVRLQAKIRNDEGWRDAVIGNVSSRGLMLKCTRAPAKGTFIELRFRSTSIVGRVVWSEANRCGVLTQDKLNFQHLGSPACRSGASSGGKVRPTRPQPIRYRTADQGADANRQLSMIAQWTTIAIAGAIAAVLLADTVSSAFEASFGRASVELGHHQNTSSHPSDT